MAFVLKGQSVGIVGKTGGGKSTLVDVLMGLLPLAKGSFDVDGHDIYKNMDSRREWLNLISHVPQHIFLSDSSIALNIASERKENMIDYDRLDWAAEKAQCTEFIEALPNKWETVVGEQGTKLSGGQRQRLGIARALYRQRPILILDEATSALDEYTEKIVIDNIKSLPQQITMIMVAHRLSTLSHCDQVIFMKNGRVIKTGPASLLKSQTLD